MASLMVSCLFVLWIWITVAFTKHPTRPPRPSPTVTPAPNLTSYTVSINQKTGDNHPDCVYPNKTCKDLHYAYHMTMSMNNIANIIMFRIYGDYVLNETFHINKTIIGLKALHFMGVEKNTKLTPSSSEISIKIGFNNTEGDISRYIPYNVSFTNLKVTGFGSKVPAVIIGWHVQFVTFHNNILIDNKCSVLNLFNCAVDIQGCLFENNAVNVFYNKRTYGKLAFPEGTASAGGAIGLIYRKQQNDLTEVVFIHNNRFINNRGEAYQSKCIAQTSDSKYLFSKSGGGILIALIGASTQNCGTVSNNQFIGNSAALGAGMMISNHGQSSENHFLVRNCTFYSNKASSTGGGFSYSNWDQASYNNLQVRDCNFTANQARVAGGMKILFQSEDQFNEAASGSQIVDLTNVIFERNRANVASGIHMIYNLGLKVKPTAPITFHNSIFAHHLLGSQDVSSGPSAFSGVVLTNRIDLMFTGDNQWYNNSFESPLYASNSEVHVQGNLTFSNNVVQTSGGGITLSDVAHIIVYPDSNLVFVDNYAHVKGGAMFVKTVGFPEMVYKYNPSCFIQYLDPLNRNRQFPPDKWKVRITFYFDY